MKKEVLCPIAYWKNKTPHTLACEELTYQEFDLLIQRLCDKIQAIKEEILVFTPQKTPLDIAFFFASFRMQKAVYPLNPALPIEAIKTRVQNTNSRWVDPVKLLSSPLSSPYLFPQTLATLIETSSSKKITCHLLKSHLASAQAAISTLNISNEDTFCLTLPLFHVAAIALAFRCFIAGAALVFSHLLSKATIVSMVPTQLFRLLETPSSLPNLKCLLIGGASLSQTLYQRALSYNLPVFSSYGMSETASLIAVKPPNSLTRILPHLRLKLAEDNEILVQGPSLLQSYFGKPPHLEKEFFATKDLGRFNKQGELEWIGRKDRQFITGGENIQPEEIEELLLQIPEVIEAKVEGVEDLEFGKRSIALIFCTKLIAKEQVVAYLEQKLPRFKIPKEITIQTTPFSSKSLQLL